MPNVILEAMGHGLAVVTRLVGGLADFFEDGKMGFASASQDPDEFAALLRALAVDPAMRAEMGAYNHRYALEHFSASRVSRRLQDLYTRIADG